MTESAIAWKQLPGAPCAALEVRSPCGCYALWKGAFLPEQQGSTNALDGRAFIEC